MIGVVNGVREDPFYSMFHLYHVNGNIESWSRKARDVGADIHSTLQKIQEIKDNMPSLNHFPAGDWRNSIVLIYQNKMRRYYLCELIRECTLQAVHRLLHDAKILHPRNLRIQTLAKDCHKWLMERVPVPVDVLHYPREYEQLYLNMEDRCNFLLYKIEEMREKLRLN